MSIRNLSPEPLSIRQVRLVRAILPGDRDRRGSPARWGVLRLAYAFGAAEREDPDGRALARLDQEYSSIRSYGLAAVMFDASGPAPAGSGAGEGLLAGFITGERQACWIDLKRDRNDVELSASCEMEGAPIAPGAVAETETLFVGFCPDLSEGLKAFAALSGRFAGFVPKAIPRGWSSHFACNAREVNRDVVLQHARFLKEQSKRLDLSVILLGDGYQTAYGDWLSANERFPGGLEELAASIRKAGLTPGLWLAPFVAQASSSLFQRHPEWMLKDPAGAPLPWDAPHEDSREPWYALDASQPEVQKWLVELFSSLRRMGFRYFALDFLYMGAVKGAHVRPVTRTEAYRQGLRAIRRGAGGSYLLGCAAPYPASAGLVDGMQVGGATAHQLFWAHRVIWNSEPGPLIVRKIDEQPREASRAAALSAMLSGGALMSGDFLARLPPERLGMVAEAVKLHRPAAAIPLDLFEEERPRLLVQKMGGNKFRLGVFNHDASARVVSVDLQRLGLARAKVSLIEGAAGTSVWKAARRLLTPPVGPHGAVLLLIEGF